MRTRRALRLATSLAVAAALLLPGASPASSFPLRAWWPLGEGKGQTVKDRSGNGHDGFLGASTGADQHDPSWFTRGAFGSALHFDGVDDFVTIPDSADLRPQRLTVAVWFRGDSSPGPFRYLLSRGGDACVSASYAIETDFTGGLSFYIWDGRRQHSSGLADASIWDGAWHLAAGTWDGVTPRLFVDGTEVPPGPSLPAPIDYGGPTGPILLGAYHGSCDLVLAGDLDAAMIWSVPLSAADIRGKLPLFNRPGTS